MSKQEERKKSENLFDAGFTIESAYKDGKRARLVKDAEQNDLCFAEYGKENDLFTTSSPQEIIDLFKKIETIRNSYAESEIDAAETKICDSYIEIEMAKIEKNDFVELDNYNNLKNNIDELLAAKTITPEGAKNFLENIENLTSLRKVFNEIKSEWRKDEYLGVVYHQKHGRTYAAGSGLTDKFEEAVKYTSPLKAISGLWQSMLGYDDCQTDRMYIAQIQGYNNNISTTEEKLRSNPALWLSDSAKIALRSFDRK